MIGAGNGTVLTWEFLDDANGGIVIDVPESLADAGEYCWVFKIQYVA